MGLIFPNGRGGSEVGDIFSTAQGGSEEKNAFFALKIAFAPNSKIFSKKFQRGDNLPFLPLGPE